MWRDVISAVFSQKYGNDITALETLQIQFAVITLVTVGGAQYNKGVLPGGQ